MILTCTLFNIYLLNFFLPIFWCHLGSISLLGSFFFAEEKTEDEVVSEPHGMVNAVKEVKMTNSSGQKKFETEEIGNKASSQLRQPEGIQVEEMQLQASSTLKPQGVVFDVEAVKILKSGEMEQEASEQHGLFLMQGGLGLTKPPKDDDWKNAKEI